LFTFWGVGDGFFDRANDDILNILKHWMNKVQGTCAGIKEIQGTTTNRE